MAKISMEDIVSLIIAGLLMGILLPIGLTDLVNIANANVTVGSSTALFSTVAPAVIITLAGTVLPILIIVAFIRHLMQ